MVALSTSKVRSIIAVAILQNTSSTRKLLSALWHTWIPIYTTIANHNMVRTVSFHSVRLPATQCLRDVATVALWTNDDEIGTRRVYTTKEDVVLTALSVLLEGVCAVTKHIYVITLS